MYYFNARYYDPAIGRFITEDPAKDEGNWYLYCRNNPLRFVDPNGMWGKNIHYGSIEYGGTIQWAKDKEFSKWEAEIIGRTCYGVDTSLKTNPVLNQSYHFNTNFQSAASGSEGDSRMILSNEHLSRAIRLQKISQT